MVAYNFQSRFASPVETGQKRQTIRALGKRRHARPGDTLQIYTGQRSTGCRKLIIPDPVCIETARIYIGHGVGRGLMIDGQIIINPDPFARADGFASFDEMLAFFERTYGLPFEGILIRW